MNAHNKVRFRRTVLLLSGLCVLALMASWLLCGRPSLALLVKYRGFPSCSATGQERLVGGIRFVELSVGYRRVTRRVWQTRLPQARWLPRVLTCLLGEGGIPSREFIDKCVENDRPRWISRTPIRRAQVISDLESAGVEYVGRPVFAAWRALQSERTGVRFCPASMDTSYYAALAGALDIHGSETCCLEDDTVLLLGTRWEGYEGTFVELRVAILEEVCAECERFIDEFSTPDSMSLHVVETSTRHGGFLVTLDDPGFSEGEATD